MGLTFIDFCDKELKSNSRLTREELLNMFVGTSSGSSGGGSASSGGSSSSGSSPLPEKLIQPANLIGGSSDAIAKLTTAGLKGKPGAEPGEFSQIAAMLNAPLAIPMANLIMQLKQQADLQNKMNEEVGLTGELSDKFRETITSTYPHAVKLGYTFADLSESVGKMLTDSGRFKLVNATTLNSIIDTSRIFFNSLKDGAGSIEQFQKISLGASDAMKAVENAGRGSLKLGLVAKQTVKTIVDNLPKLNQYGFKDGIEGLTRMAQKAQALRFNLENTLKIADQVIDPTKALEMSAKLQVIGGAFGDFNDPIRLMYDATNNVEGLQDALAKSAETLTTFNQKSGRFEIIGADLRRARDMATAFGVSLEDVTNLGVQAAQRSSAAIDLMSSSLQFNDEEKDFLTSLSQMKGGKMVIELPKYLKDEFGKAFGDTTVALEHITEDQKKWIIDRKDDFNMSLEDLAQRQVSVMENVDRNMSFIAATMRVQAGNIGEQVARRLGYDPNAINKTVSDLANKVAAGTENGTEILGRLLKETLQMLPADAFKDVKGGLNAVIDWFKQMFQKVTTTGSPATGTTPRAGVSSSASPQGNNKKEANTSTPGPNTVETDVATTKTQLDVNFRVNDAVLDVMVREIMKQPYFAKDVSSYLSKS